MNIAVCVKQVLDINLPINLDFDNKSVDQEDVIQIVNPSDMSAVEAAVRIKENRVGGKVTILSFGNRETETFLKKCLALGADEAILILEHLSHFDSHVIASVLAKALGPAQYDLILCGNKAKDMELSGGQVGPRIASLLNLPFITNVDYIEISNDGKTAKIKKKLEKGDKNIVECRLPALFTVSETINKPRYPAFPESLSAVRAEVKKLTINDIEIQEGDLEPLIEVIDIFPPKARQKKIFTPASSLSAEDRIKLMILGDPSKKKESDLIEGSSDQLASRVIEFLNSLEII
jgi:electron transfer flavoprotein beta subunit